MKVVWVIFAAFVLCSFVTVVRGDAKKYDSELHVAKKVQAKNTEETSETLQSAAKSVSDISNLERLAAINAAKAGVIQLGNVGVTAGLGPILTALLGGGVGGVNPLTGLGAALTAIFAIGAAIAAGFAALVGFIVPPLQIANQILAIIALALLVAYVVEDKKHGEDYYGYEEYDSGYGSTGYDMGYGFSDNTGYSAPASSGSGSSYTSYRRSDNKGNSDDGRTARSSAYRPMVNRVSKMVNDAVKKYSQLYD